MLRINHKHLERVRDAMSREERMDRLAGSLEPLRRWERWAGTGEMVAVAQRQQDNARAMLKVLVAEVEGDNAL